MTDPDAVVNLWEVRERGPYTVTFEWAEDLDGQVAGYLTLASPQHGHRLEAAVTWAQVWRFQQTAARQAAARSANANTGELPRMGPRKTNGPSASS